MPSRPNLVKGALVSVAANAKSFAKNDPVFVFQYNPQTLTRTLSNLDQDEPKVAPKTQSLCELVYLVLELDAADQLEHPNQNPIAVENGLHPALSALESVLKPSTAKEPQVTLFFWGPKRVLPVCLVDVTVVEEAFDPQLKPIRATIDLCLRILDLTELKTGSIGYKLYQNHLQLKNNLSTLYQQSLNTNPAALFAQASATNRKATLKTSPAKPLTTKVVKAVTRVSTQKKPSLPPRINRK
ncbi:MAG: hypothetical protein NWF04_07490 [Candidatus Bathyarchaeota archaeon]|nr:hypothetical protein [Candidatus Bathyarchaeota archaeon]